MKKNTMMRIASALLVLTLLSTCAISGTFAKYVTTATGDDSARVANWGFTTTTMNISNLFANAYKYNETAAATGEESTSVVGTSSADVIAPGTAGSATFKFAYDGQEAAPEVAYNFEVSTTGSECATDIQSNTAITWSLDNGAYGTWNELIAAIEKLDGSEEGAKEYAPGELPTGFSASDDVHTISWKWDFAKEGNDSTDTALGNKATLDSVKLVITVTATQVN